MKQYFLAGAIALASSSAFAADVITEQPPVAPEAVNVPTFTWTGGYLGVQGGPGWVNGDFSGSGVSRSDTFNGGRVGGFAGYNYQFDNNVVLGVEGDVNYNWNKNTYADGVDVGTDVDGSVRARLGYAMDKWLVYGTAGWAVTRGYVDVPGVGKDHSTFNGYTVGAGVDYAFTDNIFGRAEYRFSDYGDKNISGVNADFNQNTVTVGVGVKF